MGNNTMLFCSHNEEEGRGLIATNISSKNVNTAKKFLDELDVFSVREPESRESSEQCSLKRQESSSISDSTPKQDEEDEILWKEALDPRSGKVYYYHSVSRKTTWHKPEEIRAMEKRLKEEKKRQDKLFFQEMERNIIASLEKKECIPGLASQEELKILPADETPSIEGTKQRVRTISGMDESLLAQLNIGPKPVVPTAAAVVPKKPSPTSSTTAADIRGRPPLPKRASSRDTAAADSMTLSPDECDAKYPDLTRRDSEGAELLAGENLLDAPIHEDVNLGEQGGALQKNHVRRNTGGTIYVKSTMTNPNIKATIKCVCVVYREHILQAAEKNATSSPVSVASPSKEGLALIFMDDQFARTPKDQSRDVPSLEEVMSFYENFYERSQMEIDTIIMSLIYVERLVKETNGLIVPGTDNWKSILFSCMVLASKIWDDLSMWNVDFANVAARNYALASFTLRRINELELALLKCLNFIVRVPASEYAKYYFLIRSMLMKSGNLDEGGEDEKSDKPLDLKEAEKLETLSTIYQEAAALSSAQGNTSTRRSRSLNDHDFSSQKAEKATPAARQSVCLEQLVTMNR